MQWIRKNKHKKLLGNDEKTGVLQKHNEKRKDSNENREKNISRSYLGMI